MIGDDETELAADLATTWDEAEAKPEEIRSTPEADHPQAEPIEDQFGRLRDPRTKRFVRKTQSEESETPASPSETPALAPAVAAPEHWSQVDKDRFNSLPEELKPLYREKVKSLESGYNRKFEEIADERKAYEGLNQIFGAEQRQQLAEEGKTPGEYVGTLVKLARSLEANPEGMLHWLAQKYGVTLGNDELPAVTALNAEVHQLQTQIQQQAATQALAEDWYAFQGARGANGSPLYPGVEKLKAMMGHILQSSPPQPGETTRQALDRAYHAAYADAYAAIKPKIDAEAAERQRKADVARARKATGPSVRSKTTPGANARIPASSWKDELDSVWDQVG
jgi:hypothetical protein